MRKIIFHLSTGYAGMDSCEVDIFPDDISDENLDDEAWTRAVQHAESYGIYPTSYLEDSLMDGDEIGNEEYSDNIEGWWEDYDPERHKGMV